MQVSLFSRVQINRFHCSTVFKSSDRSLVQNYLKSHSCNVSKVITNDKIVSFVTSSIAISHNQSDLLRGKSTIQELLLLLIYLHFHKAFVSVPHNNLLCQGSRNQGGKGGTGPPAFLQRGPCPCWDCKILTTYYLWYSCVNPIPL